MQRTHKNGEFATNAPTGVSGPVSAFEDQLARDSGWALSEGSKFFEGRGAVKETMRKICKKLNELGISYAVVGGMALSHHGFPRFTVDVDLLVTADGLKQIHHRLDGLGYIPPFARSKNLRDTETGVKIEFLIAGQYPGDGKPKPVSFPDPDAVAVIGDGIRYVNLATLVELKIASGMTSPERMKDLADAQELIKTLILPAQFGEGLNPFVRDKFHELWQGARPAEKRYITILISNQSVRPRTLTELIAWAAHDAAKLKAMLADGVSLDPERGAGEKFYLVTNDPAIAKKYDMHEESEFWDDPSSVKKE